MAAQKIELARTDSNKVLKAVTLRSSLTTTLM
jgi:hypothetical protein